MIVYLIRWALRGAIYSEGKMDFLLKALDYIFPFYEKCLMCFCSLIQILYPPVKRSQHEPLYSWIVRCNRIYGVVYLFILSEINEIVSYRLFLKFGGIEHPTKRIRGILRQLRDEQRRFKKTQRLFGQYRKRYIQVV